MKKVIALIVCLTSLLAVTVFPTSADETRNNHAVFSDIDTGGENSKWYSTAVYKVYYNGWMIGTAETTFSPDVILTREQAAVILFRALHYKNKTSVPSEPPHYDKTSFKDVEPNKWYSDYVEYAYQSGWLAGIGNGYFGIGKSVTRQDAMVMLDHYYININNPSNDDVFYDVLNSNFRQSYISIRERYPIPTDFAHISDYSDEADISEYAKKSVESFLTPYLTDIERTELGIKYPCPSEVWDLSSGYIHPKFAMSRAEFAFMLWHVFLSGRI